MSSGARRKGRRGSRSAKPTEDAPSEAEASETAASPAPPGDDAAVQTADGTAIEAEPEHTAQAESEAEAGAEAGEASEEPAADASPAEAEAGGGEASDDATVEAEAAPTDAEAADHPGTVEGGTVEGGTVEGGTAEAPETDAEEGEVPGEDDASGPGLEKARSAPVGLEHLETVIESLVFVSDKPLPAHRLARIARATQKDVLAVLETLIGRYRGRGIELAQVAGGYQFRSAAASAPFVRDLVAKKPVRLSRAQIETLAIAAYRQPLTRPELEDVRGVDSGSALKVLLEKGLVKILGRRDEPGRPLLYGTTPAFLELFGLSALSELPTLHEHTELTDESRALFARKMSEDIESIGDVQVDTHHYTDEEIEAAEKAALRQREIEAGIPDQSELFDGATASDAEDEPAERPAAGDGEDDDE